MPAAPDAALPTRRSLREAAGARQARAEASAITGLFARILTVRAFRAHQGPSRKADTPVALVGETLRAAGAHGVLLLHHRRVPGTRAPVGYLAVCASGVYVIDVVRHKNVPIDLRTDDKGPMGALDLVVGARVMTSSAAATARRARAVRTVLDQVGLDTVPVIGALTVVEGVLPPGCQSVQVCGIHALNQSNLATLVSQVGSLDAESRQTLQEYLAEQFPQAP